MANLKDFLDLLGEEEFEKVSLWEAEGGSMAEFAELGEFGALGFVFQSREALREAIRTRRFRIDASNQPDGALRPRGAGPVSMPGVMLPLVPSFPIGRAPVVRSGPADFSSPDLSAPAFRPPRSRAAVAPVEAAPEAKDDGDTKEEDDRPTPQETDQLIEDAIKRAAVHSNDPGIPERIKRAIRDNPAAAKRAATAAAAGIISAIAGGASRIGRENITTTAPDGGVVIKFPMPDGSVRTEIVYPGGSRNQGGGMSLSGGGSSGDGAPLKGKYRTPRRGRWNNVLFKKYTDAAAIATGSQASGLSLMPALNIRAPAGPRRIKVN